MTKIVSHAVSVAAGKSRYTDNVGFDIDKRDGSRVGRRQVLVAYFLH